MSQVANTGVTKPNAQGVTTRTRRRLYSSTQIRAVLASCKLVAQAAAEAGVAEYAARHWRDGVLPQWFADEERARASERPADATARFYNPADRRAGR